MGEVEAASKVEAEEWAGHRKAQAALRTAGGHVLVLSTAPGGSLQTLSDFPPFFHSRCS